MQTIKLNRNDNGVMTLCMHRPEVHNAFNPQMIGELTETLSSAGQDPAIRLVVITGTGKSFSAGADLNWMRSLVDASQQDNENDALHLAKLLRTLNYLPKPTVARVNGPAFGGGVGLIAACDITIAVENARFALSEARLGLVPAVISPYVFRRIGEGNARRYFMTAERFDAGQALQMGLVQQCTSMEDLDHAVDAVIAALLKGGPFAVSGCKQLVFAVSGHDASKQRRLDQYTAKLIAALRVSDEGQEGLAAFLEKRLPGWMSD